MKKYSKDQKREDKEKEISNCKNALIIAIDIHHMTGKEAIELVREKSK